MQEDQVIVWGLSLQIAEKEENEKLWTLLGRKAMKNLDSVLKSKDITLPTKVGIVKAMIFPVVMYRCESWTVKKAECWRIDAFKLWFWKGSWESLGKKGDQTSQSERKTTLNTLWKYWCWSWSSNSLATWYEDMEMTLMLGKIEGRRRGGNRGWDGWMFSLTQWTWVCANSRTWWRTGKPGVLQSMWWQRAGHDWATEQQASVSFQ